jgi:hypothetical protein
VFGNGADRLAHSRLQYNEPNDTGIAGMTVTVHSIFTRITRSYLNVTVILEEE